MPSQSKSWQETNDMARKLCGMPPATAAHRECSCGCECCRNNDAANITGGVVYHRCDCSDCKPSPAASVAQAPDEAVARMYRSTKSSPKSFPWTLEVSLRGSDGQDLGDDSDMFDLEVSVEGTYTPGSPATGPTYSCGGTPADPPDFEIECVTVQIGNETVDLTDALTDNQREAIINHGLGLDD